MNSALRHKGAALKPGPPGLEPELSSATVTIGLNAAVVAVRSDEPMIAIASTPQGAMLPSALFCPRTHTSLDSGLRQCVYRQTGLELGFLQQLSAFEDWFPPAVSEGSPFVLSLCYLALVGPGQDLLTGSATWRSWYDFFPWEDWRCGKPSYLVEQIEPRLRAWAARPSTSSGSLMSLDRGERLRLYFGFGGTAWDEEKVVERYGLLCEAGLLGSPVAGGPASLACDLPALSHPLLGDQGRMLATAIGELRRTIKCRAAVFELMPDLFTLFELQKTVEALLGPHLHKQNFRRLVESGGLVEPTGSFKQRTGGRPAQLYRFRRDVLLERLAPGVRVKSGRG